MSKQEVITEIEPRSGAAFTLKKGQKLKVIDPKGEQVSDLICYSQNDIREYLSSGRTLDYNSKIYLSRKDFLYSNRSQIMLEILEDTVGRHDFLLTPCSKDTFRILYQHDNPHRGCHGNLVEALSAYGILEDSIPVTFNTFMNVAVNADTGELKVLPPKSQAGDFVIFEAKMDLIVGLTACSAEQSNNYAFKPIHYQIF